MIQMLDLKRMVPGKYGGGKTSVDSTDHNINAESNNLGSTNFRVKPNIGNKTGGNFYLS